MITDLTGRIREAIQGMSVDKAISAMKAYIADPTANMSAVLVSVIIVVLVLLAVALFLVYRLMPRQRVLIRTRRYAEGAPEPDETPVAEEAAVADESAHRKSAVRRTLDFWGSGIGVALILLFGIGVAYGVTSTTDYCFELCHAQSKSVVAAREIDHAGCSDCHEGRGVVGIIGNSASRSRMAILALVGKHGVDSAPVDSRACLRCHADVLERTSEVKGGLRVAHVHIVKGGDPCTYCHAGAGHTRAGYSQGMARCIVCHDGATAPTKCDTCHSRPAVRTEAEPGTTAQQVSSGNFVYTPVNAFKPYCDGCHDVARRCDPCHGVRMPHDDAFIEGGHARDAAFEGKQICWKCHSPETDCGSPCHGGFKRTGISGHPPDWKVEHRIEGGSGMCGCHRRYSGRKGPMCPICH